MLDHARGQILVAAREAARRDGPAERRPRLERELVGRDVLGAMGDQLVEIAIEELEGLLREREDQIEREILETRRARGEERFAGHRSPVGATEPLEQRVLERLDSDREAIDACGSKTGQTSELDGARIELEGDLDRLGRRRGGEG